ncbi:MAG: DUF5058 family protein [Clostridia bacterium]|nr:DUF5058 family protein [Clostridia bacterium]
MEFSVNHPILFIIVAAIIAVVLAQSIYFLVRAVRRAKEIGISRETLKKTAVASVLFTIAPAVAILIGVITLSKSLGIALPWLRLSVIGSLSYETVAAGTTLTELGKSMGEMITDASDYITVAWVMTVGIIIGLILTPLLTKKVQSGMLKIGSRDKKWGEIFNNALFLGMISAFLGYVFSDVLLVVKGDFSGLIPVCVMLTAAVVMLLCGLLNKITRWRWITDYAVPISLLCGMAMAIPYTAWLG